MSMLSAQCDELRAMAESVGLAMPQAATLMMGAADTIWELRCKCAGMVDMRERARLAETENAKLREEIEAAKHDLSVFSGEIVASKAENAKLRELVKDLYDVAEFSINYFGDTYDIRKRMDALGIEVDDGTE